MENNAPTGRSYWDHLGEAERALDAGDLPRAERQYEAALSARSHSPGRVFFTEKLTDGLSRLVRGKSNRPGSDGRWQKKSGQFRRRFLDDAEKIVRDAVRLAELRPEDEADANQQVLESALFLVGRSRLFGEESASAVPLLKGLFRTAAKSGRPFSVQLIRHDIPLTEEDRLWLARKGPELLEEFTSAGMLERGSTESETWVQTILQLLHPQYFGSTDRLEEERAWLEAITTDHFLCRPEASVGSYRRYLEVKPEPGQRTDEARIRLLELLGNTDRMNFPVPCYDQALGAMQAAGLAPGSKLAARFQTALEQIEYRRPAPASGNPDLAWASVALEPDGSVAVVFWWQFEPRDLAFWKQGQDPSDLAQFLEACQGRIVALDQAVPSALEDIWPEGPALWSVKDFTAAFLEPVLPEDGLTRETLLRLGLGESGPWREKWRPDLGQALLEPPRRSALLESWQGRQASGALLGGLVWLAVLARIHRSDPSLRAGIGAMARRGDPAARFLYGFLNLDEGLGQALDASFEPWTLPLLWTRPDPFGWTRSGTAQGAFPAPQEEESQARPDLGHNDLAIVTTGDPGPVLSAWGQGRQKWRVVLDRLDRLGDLARVAGGAIGPVTLIPASGQVHSLRGCLGLLEEMLNPAQRPRGPVEGLLPLFHWVRLVESHNGDVLDFQQVRSRPGTEASLYDRYRERVANLELVPPALEPSPDSDPWAVQFAQRVRKAGLVAGLADGLTLDPDDLDSRWGVFEGSEVSWVFLDSAAIHWYLLNHSELPIQDLHGLLFSRGSRHLSLLTGAVWMRSDLEELLGTWLGVFGSPYCLALTNLKAPQLRLADGGVAAHAVHQRVDAMAGPVAQVSESIELAGSGAILLPRRGPAADLWRRLASGEISLGKTNWHFLHQGHSSDTALMGHDPVRQPEKLPRLLLVPVLDSLAEDNVPLAEADRRESWQRADRERNQYFLWRRRLCGLEFAGLLAGPWEIVEVLDCRWWRILELPGFPDPKSPGAQEAWTGKTALALTEAESCRLFDLPGSSKAKGRSIHPNIAEAVRHWLSTVAYEGPAEDDLALPAPSASGPLFTTQSFTEVWSGLWQPIARDWERGDMGQWLLLVSDQVPEGAAAGVGAGFSPGISVWSSDRVSGRPSPLIWCRARDLGDPELQSLLKKQPCAQALAQGVQDWLPSRTKANQSGALALRVLLDHCPDRLTLQFDAISSPWADYFSRTTGSKSVPELPEAKASDGADSLFNSSAQETASVGTEWPDTGQTRSARVSVRRLRGLLIQLRPALGLDAQADAAQTDATRDRLVSLEQLSWLAGLPAHQIEAAVRALRWVARVAGDSLSDAGSGTGSGTAQGGGHSLLIPRRFAEIEHQLAGLQDLVSVVLPLMLGELSPGRVTWIDLEHPSVDLDKNQLNILDRFLAASAAAAENLGLVYRCPRGALNSPRRLVGASVPVETMVERLQQSLNLFSSRLADIMSSADETGSGFLVQTGLDQLRPDERDFLALGDSLGFWVWSGPPCQGALHLVDLLTVADSPTVKQGQSGWSLLELEFERVHEDDTDPRPVTIPEAEDPSPGKKWLTGGLKSLLPGTDKPADFESLTRKVSELITTDGGARQLVVTGLTGTGRHEGLVRGLFLGEHERGQIGEVFVYAPDTAAAAHFMGCWDAQGFQGPVPRVHIVGKGQHLPKTGKDSSSATSDDDTVVIMLEIHRFDPEVRYQVAQLGRGRRLLMTTDPVAATEPWEHLFLTIPRSEEIIRLQGQRRISRRLWSEIQELIPEGERTRGHSQASAKGTVTTSYAVNLDQCLARMIEDVEEEKLPRRFRLVGPLQADLDFLAGSLDSRGWLTVSEEELDFLFLPGARELMATLVEALGRIGKLTRYLPGKEISAGGGEEPEPVFSTDEVTRFLPAYLGPEAAAGLAAWRPVLDSLEASSSCRELLELVEQSPWGRSLLACPEAWRRAVQTLRMLGPATLGDLVDHPLWESWWHVARQRLGMNDLSGLRPLVTLAPADRIAGTQSAAGVYLCLGSELPRRHYNVLSRLTDQVLILFKEKSPLAHDEAR